MDGTVQQPVVCQVCGLQKRPDEVMPAALVRPAIAEAIRKKHPDWSSDGFISHDDLDLAKAEYVQDSFEDEKGELTRLEADVLRSMKKRQLLARNINSEFENKMSFGERAADKVATFGGSWRFIGIFAAVLFGWIMFNAVVLLNKGFDPYPFILLNLALSCIASIQAPIIMMSQNRASSKDRLQAEHDYQINLKAEMEIRSLHEKMDHLLRHQWQRLLEI